MLKLPRKHMFQDLPAATSVDQWVLIAFVAAVQSCDHVRLHSDMKKNNGILVSSNIYFI